MARVHAGHSLMKVKTKNTVTDAALSDWMIKCLAGRGMGDDFEILRISNYIHTYSGSHAAGTCRERKRCSACFVLWIFMRCIRRAFCPPARGGKSIYYAQSLLFNLRCQLKRKRRCTSPPDRHARIAQIRDQKFYTRV